jgi:integrase
MSVIDQFLEYLRLDKGLSSNTLATYTRTFRTFPNVATATREDVEAWWRLRSDKSVATRLNELSALRSFYKWAAIYEHRPLGDDPTYRIPNLKLPHGQPHPISRHDLHLLLNAFPDDLRRAVCLGAYAGLRVSEAANQSWADIDLETNRIRVTGKGGKVRLVGISPVLLDSLLPNTGGNVVAGGKKAYSPARLQQKINEAMRGVGVSATFHSLRHRFATQALAGSNLLAVSRALGHVSPATTAIYAATSDTDLDVIAETVTR